MNTVKHTLMGLLRICLGWIFLWPFLDKAFGLGFTTCLDKETGTVMTMCEKAWVQGGSPTMGFLKFGTHGPLADIFQAMAGSVVVDWLFMVGLLLIGVSLMLGVLVRIAGVSGAVMLVLMYVAALPPSHNPVIDDHIIYALMLLTLVVMPAGRWLGLGKAWQDTALVRNNSWLA